MISSTNKNNKILKSKNRKLRRRIWKKNKKKIMKKVNFPLAKNKKIL